MNLLKKIFNTSRNLTPHEFIIKFMKDSKRKHVQLELYHSDKIILQIESLKHVPIWVEWSGEDVVKYKNGYVVNFFLNKKELDKNQFYKNYKESERILNMTQFNDYNYDIVNFTYFFKKDIEPLEIGKYMRKVIDNVYRYKEENPQILFNLRYLKKI